MDSVSNLYRKRTFVDDDKENGNGSKKPNLAKYSNWKNAKSQKSFGTEFLRIEPMQPLEDVPPNLVEFEMTSTRPLKFNNLTRFFIKGQFQTRDLATTVTDKSWKPCSLTDADEVVVQYNWLEKLLNSINIYHEHTQISPHDESPWVNFELNTMLYYYMDPAQKRILCPDSSHPAWHVPVTNKDYDFPTGTAVTEFKNWKNYAAHIFGTKGFEFNYIPFNIFPFYQYPNYITDSKNMTQTDLPFPDIGKMFVRFNFKPTQDIFLKKPTLNSEGVDTNKKEYRVIFKSFYLNIEEERGNPTSAKSKQAILYRGISKDSKAETIKDGEFTYKTRFQNIAMPEQMLIVALNNKIVGGKDTFKDLYKSGDGIYKKHNIKEVHLTYNGVPFINKEPNFEQIDNETTVLKYVQDVLRNGFFGMRVDPKKVTYDEAKNENKLFPHVFMDYTLDGGSERILPIQSDGSSYKQDGSLEIQLKFNEQGAAPSASYLIYLSYNSGVNMVYNFQTNKFTPINKNAGM